MAALLHALDGPDPLRAIVAFIGALVRADTWMVILFRRESGPAVLYFQHGRQRRDTAYARGLYLLDPVYHALREGRPAGCWFLDEVAPDGFRRSTFYKTYYTRYGCTDEADFIVPVGGGTHVCISLSRAAAPLWFAARERAALRALAPVVEAAVQRVFPPPADTAQRVEARVRGAVARFGDGLLTNRERDMVALLLRGHSAKSGARALGISPETVKAHMRNVRAKLGTRTQAELFSRFLAWYVEGRP